MPWLNAAVYGIPLSITGAIIIPSVGGFESKAREFMVYESTFSDIFGIMAFTCCSETKPAPAASPFKHRHQPRRNAGHFRGGGVFARVRAPKISGVRLFLSIAVLLLICAIKNCSTSVRWSSF